MSTILKEWVYDYGGGHVAHIHSYDGRTFLVSFDDTNQPGTIGAGDVEGASSLEAAMDIADKWTGIETDAANWSGTSRTPRLSLGPAMTAGEGPPLTHEKPTQYRVEGMPPGVEAIVENDPRDQLWRIRVETPQGTPLVTPKTFGRPDEALMFLEIALR